MNKYDVIVIGSGPSGLTAAYKAASSGKKVLVLERGDEPAKKIYITGNGRCNFANEKYEKLDTVLAHAKAIGLAYTKEEGRYYPRSFQAKDAAKAFIKAAEKAGAQILCSCSALDVQKREQGFEVQSDKGQTFTAGKLILACGGKAAIHLGCTGDGYKWAEKLGLKVKKPIPALTGMVPSEDISGLHGIRVNAKVAMLENGKETAFDLGEVQFTKNGISGICVMNLSRYFRIAQDKSFVLKTDLFPEYTEEELSEILKQQKKALGDHLACLLPEKLAVYIEKKAQSGNAEKLARLCKNLSFKIESSKGWKEAQVTSGGIETDQLSEYFEAKAVPGLFAVGELTDYDGPCGGFNIGYAIYSGLKAGEKAAE